MGYMSMSRARVLEAIIVTAIVVEAFFVALMLRFEGMVPSAFWTGFAAIAALAVAVFVAFLWRRLGDPLGGYGLETLLRVTLLAAGVLLLLNLVSDLMWARLVPPSVILSGTLFAFVQLAAVRFLRALASRAA